MAGTQPETARDRALARARATRRETGAELPPRRSRPAATRPPAEAAPVDDAVAKLATRYLVDGYQPDEVADRLGVDRGWCRAIAARLQGRR
ncbi:hypothetical protein GA0070610_1795 [Micromonospora echinofusca]|uniref:Uncharacterized protein n=1 Tax=Micromonospora echinofusca TaxID=47858 RepID=A0A1C5G726_MICEH|nr:hypothetical protein [Micromonospora echinofusca]SCG15561.1 hypothetical protein GA0070610_1795 [Micromonospora echinofusca]